MTYFSGETYDHDRDGKRLGKQMKAVMEEVLNHPCQRYTLYRLSAIIGAPEASTSARLRDLRKPRFGSYNIERAYIEEGLWEYWYQPEGQAVMQL